MATTTWIKGVNTEDCSFIGAGEVREEGDGFAESIVVVGVAGVVALTAVTGGGRVGVDVGLGERSVEGAVQAVEGGGMG